ncbi:MAG: hypothetical protein C0478_03025 [Planctomyces sp.]|nr:hypothetical protein [Planctomyces sp.]
MRPSPPPVPAHLRAPRRGAITTFVVAAIVLFGLTSAAMVVSAVMILGQGESSRRTLQMDFVQRAVEWQLREKLASIAATTDSQTNTAPDTGLWKWDFATGGRNETALVECRLVSEPESPLEYELRVTLQVRGEPVLVRRSRLAVDQPTNTIPATPSDITN